VEANDWPWAWPSVDAEEFTAELCGDGRAQSTIRACESGLRQFLDYVADPRYQWTAVCERLNWRSASQRP
jgi:integrase/recombinase XerC